MAKCEYKFNFEIKCDEPIRELRIKLVDKNGRRVMSAAPVETKQESLDFGSSDDDDSDDISDEIPPEMNSVF